MHSLIMKISHSLGLKDTIAVGRGLYRVVEGGLETARINNRRDCSEKVLNSHKDLPIEPIKHYYHPDIQEPSFKTEETIHLKQKDEREKTIPSPSAQSTQQDFPHKKQSPFPQAQSSQSEQFLNVSKVPAGRFERFYQFGRLGKQMLEFGVEAYVAKNISGSDSKTIQSIYERAADKITQQLCKMRGAPLKLAQMLSIQQDDLIPPPIRKAFERARESAHVMPLDEVHAMLEQNLGKDEWKIKLPTFEEKPFAAASIGQVHRAKTVKGEEVAVKVQYPGVRRSVGSDMKNLRLLMKVPGLFPKGIYIDKILQKTEEELGIECNYSLQKEKQELYEKCLNKVLSGYELRKFRVPAIFHHLSTENVLTSEYLRGMKMKEVEEGKDIPQDMRDQIGRRMMKLTFLELFQMGVMQSDPNPSNFTYNHRTDELNLFDFGATHVYKRSFLAQYFNIIQGSIRRDRGQIIESSIKTGFLTGEESQVMLDSHVESIVLIGDPLRFQGKYDFGQQEITKKIYKTIPLMLKNRLKSPPEEVYSLHRKLSGSYLACMRLGARVDCRELMEGMIFRSAVSQLMASDVK